MQSSIGGRRRKHARVRRVRAHHSSLPRAASAAGLFGICMVVLVANAVWWNVERGYPMGMSLLDALPGLGRASAGAAARATAAPTAADGKTGLMLSVDVDITQDPGPEVASSRWTSPQDGVIELYARDEASIPGGGRSGTGYSTAWRPARLWSCPA